MKKYIFLISLTALIFGCQKKNESVLKFDSEPAEKFIKIIEYIEKSSNQKLSFNKFSEKLITSNYINNKADNLLNTKINNLLELSAYNKLNKDAIAYADTSIIKGKDAYKLALLNLPYKRTRMNGDRTSLWVDYWENKHNLQASKFLKDINKNSDRIKNKAIRLSNEYYPSNIVKKDTIQTFFCIDGYRSSFTSENIIYMELISSNNFNIERFTKILSHELHHINYSNWLLNNYEFISDKQKGVYNLQRGFILEGIAQQINFVDYNKQVKKLYYNKELLLVLNKNFIDDFLRISKSKTPIETSNESNSDMWRNSSTLLEKYCTEKFEENTISHRPTFKYYISYQLYKVIKENGENGDIKYAIEHPEFLLEIYNNLRNENNIIPKYPDEIVQLWKTNFK
jgi:hypothetical protein